MKRIERPAYRLREDAADAQSMRFYLLGLSKVVRAGECVDHLLVYHPEGRPYSLYAMDMVEFNKTYRPWKEE